MKTLEELLVSGFSIEKDNLYVCLIGGDNYGVYETDIGGIFVIEPLVRGTLAQCIDYVECRAQ